MLMLLASLLLCLSLPCVNLLHLRLVPVHSGAVNGRLEVCDLEDVDSCTEEDFLRVADVGFHAEEATAACQELGYEDGQYHVNSYYNDGEPKEYWGAYFRCPSSASVLTTCTQVQSSSFSGYNDASVFCYSNNKAIVIDYGNERGYNYGRGRTYGFVAIRSASRFNYVLDTGWDDNDALVVCRESGFTGAKAYSGSKFGFDHDNVRKYVTDVSCTGAEDALADCGGSEINSAEDNVFAAAYCYNEEPILNFTDTRIFYYWSEQQNTYGDIQFLYDGIWGRYCDLDGLVSEEIANVSCRAIGMLGGWPRPFGVGSRRTNWQPFWVRDLSCVGDKASLMDCTWDHAVVESDQGCSTWRHSSAVLCYNSTDELSQLTLSWEEYAAPETLLEDIPGNNFLFAEWRGIRATIQDANWTNEDATVACRMLNYTYGYPMTAQNRRGSSSYPPEPGLLENFTCTGTEQHLSECPMGASPGYVTLDHTYAVSVWCTNSITQLTSTDLRLSGNEATPYYGAVQIQWQGLWGNVCWDHDWTEVEATVVCRQLNYNYGLQNPDFDVSRSEAPPYWMTGVSCDGTEDAIWDCSFNGWGDNVDCYVGTDDAGVLCYNHMVTLELLGGRTWRGGNVVINVDEEAGTMADYHWGHYEGKLICWLWGHNINRMYRKNSYYNTSEGRVWNAGMYCASSTDTNFWDCAGQGWGQGTSRYDDHLSDAGVFCSDLQIRATTTYRRQVNYGSFYSYRHYYNSYDTTSPRLIITVDVNHRVKLTFDFFELESDWVEGCDVQNDTVLVYDGQEDTDPQIGVFCGTEMPPVVRTTDRFMHIYFRNDGDSDNEGKGFAAVWEAECLGKTTWSEEFTSWNVSKNIKKFSDMNTETLCHVQCDIEYPRCNGTLFDLDNDICYIQIMSYYQSIPVDLSTNNVSHSIRQCEVYDECVYGGSPGWTTDTDVYVLHQQSVSEISYEECVRLCLQMETCTHIEYNDLWCKALYGSNNVSIDSDTHYKIECQVSPEILSSSPQNLTLYEGDGFSISVNISLGIPIADVVWHRDGSELTLTDHYVSTVTSDTAILTVTELDGSETGRYHMTLSNVVDSHQTETTNVTVLMAPAIISGQDEVVAVEGDDVDFTLAIFLGYPVGTVTWYQNEMEEIVDDVRYTVTSSEDFTTLSVTNAQQDLDGDMYILVLSNSVQDVRFEVVLVVNKRTTTDAGGSNGLDTGGVNAQLGSADGSGGSSGAMVGAGIAAALVIGAIIAAVAAVIIRRKIKNANGAEPLKLDDYSKDDEIFSSRGNSVAPVTYQPEFDNKPPWTPHERY